MHTLFATCVKAGDDLHPHGPSTIPSYPGKPPAPGFCLVGAGVITLMAWADPSGSTWWCFPWGGWFGSTANKWQGAVKTAFLGCECTCLPLWRRPCLESSGRGQACLSQENPLISVSNTYFKLDYVEMTALSGDQPSPWRHRRLPWLILPLPKVASPALLAPAPLWLRWLCQVSWMRYTHELCHCPLACGWMWCLLQLPEIRMLTSPVCTLCPSTVDE